MKTCENANHTSEEKCQKHIVKKKSTENSKCKLIINNIKIEDSGLYRIFSNNKLITRCHVMVNVPELNHWLVISVVLFIVILILVTLLSLFLKTKKQSNNLVGNAAQTPAENPEQKCMLEEQES